MITIKYEKYLLPKYNQWTMTKFLVKENTLFHTVLDNDWQHSILAKKT